MKGPEDFDRLLDIARDHARKNQWLNVLAVLGTANSVALSYLGSALKNVTSETVILGSGKGYK